jgi:hypothetical protein
MKSIPTPCCERVKGMVYVQKLRRGLIILDLLTFVRSCENRLLVGDDTGDWDEMMQGTGRGGPGENNRRGAVQLGRFGRMKFYLCLS